MSTSPTQLTLKHLRKLGCFVEVTERWNPFAHIRQDLFNVVDVLALDPEGGTIAVQTTGDNGGNVAKRIQKIADAEATPFMRKAGWKILVHGWRKKDGRWVLREVDVS